MFKKRYSSKLKQAFEKTVEIVPYIDIHETKNYLTKLSEEETKVLDNELVGLDKVHQYRYGIGKEKLISRIFKELDTITLNEEIEEKKKKAKQKILLYEYFTFDRRLNQKNLVLLKQK